MGWRMCDVLIWVRPPSCGAVCLDKLIALVKLRIRLTVRNTVKCMNAVSRPAFRFRLRGSPRSQMPATYPTTGPVYLRTNLKTYGLTTALKAGTVSSPLVSFDFCGPEKVFEGFKPMVRDGEYDAGELALVTFLQAKIYDKPLTLLPACIVGKFQHNTLYFVYRGKELTPKDIEGRQAVGRAYTQTTAVWARGILQHEFGVDLSKVTWLTSDDPHLGEYSDPANVVRVSNREKSLEQRMIDGEADFGIFGFPAPKHPDIRRLIPDHETAAAAWYAKYGCAQINHMFVVRPELAQARPDVVAEIFRLLAASKAAAGLASKAIDALPFGVENVSSSLAMLSQYSCEQGILPRTLGADELFNASMRALKVRTRLEESS